MRAPRGFGRRYFTLAAIQAYSAGAVQRAAYVCLENYALTLEQFRESDDDPPDDPPEALACFQSDKPCHCDCYFRRRTFLTLRGCRKKSGCNCNCRFYSFRRSGVHPPRSFSFFTRY